MSDIASVAPDHDDPVVAVCPDPHRDQSLLRGAARLSVDLDLPLLPRPRVRGLEMLLVVAPSRLELRVVGGAAELRGGRPVCVDLTRLDTASGAGRSRQQPLAKAVGIRRGATAPTVIDATAGFGQDAWLLGSWGCHVMAVERHPVVATLLRDALLRAIAIEPSMQDRIVSVQSDGLAMMRRMAGRNLEGRSDLSASMRAFCRPEVVYLDPMFPAGRRTVERKALRVLRRLVGDDPDALALLSAARSVARHRVVVKRPLRAAPLAPEPTTSFKGNAVRYDIYVTKG